MLLSLALIFILGIALGKFFNRINMPSLLGMLLTGIMLSPYVFNLIDENILNISSELRKIALIIILSRAGMNLDLRELKKVGRPAFLMCFVPACFEILGITILAPILLGVTHLEAIVIGTVVSAVSPAIIVPKMLKLKDEGYGTNKSIPQLIMAGASVDDVFVIVLFTTFSGLLQSGEMNSASFLVIPTSVIFGSIGGFIVGILLYFLFTKVQLNTNYKVLTILSLSFLFLTFEDSLNGFIGFSGTLAVMSLGISLKIKNNDMTKGISNKFSSLWAAAEILLFVLVGATVNPSSIISSGFNVVLLIILALIFRVTGVLCCLIKSDLNVKERLFVSVSYLPKATVQAAIGGLPLAMGLSVGNVVLNVAVVSILVTAPIGAFLIDILYKKCLTKTNKPNN